MNATPFPSCEPGSRKAGRDAPIAGSLPWIQAIARAYLWEQFPEGFGRGEDAHNHIPAEGLEKATSFRRENEDFFLPLFATEGIQAGEADLRDGAGLRGRKKGENNLLT